MAKQTWHGASNGPEPPCYDRLTKTDCPDRHGGCQLNCEKWQAYVVERDKVYEKRKNDALANSTIVGHRTEAHSKFTKKEQRMKRYFR